MVVQKILDLLVLVRIQVGQLNLPGGNPTGARLVGFFADMRETFWQRFHQFSMNFTAPK